MRILRTLTIVAVAAILLSGCASVKEFAKSVWGSSTRALEEARSEAEGKTFRCSLDECFDAVLVLTEKEIVKPVVAEDQETEEDQELLYVEKLDAMVEVSPLDLFIKDRKRSLLVVMGVPGSVDTTEVGIFFDPQADGNVRVEVSSLSTNAKQITAKMVFSKLLESFPEVQ